MTYRIGILVDGRRRLLYQEGLVDRLSSAFGACGIATHVIDLAREAPEVHNYDLFYPLPVVYSPQLELFLLDWQSKGDAPRIINPPNVQFDTLDKARTISRLRDASVPFPETLETNDPQEVLEFVRHHDVAILKAATQVAGLGHLVVESENNQLYAWIPDIKRHRQLSWGKASHSQLSGKGKGEKIPVTILQNLTNSTTEELSNRKSPRLIAPFLVQRLIKPAKPGTFYDRVFRVYLLGNTPIFGTERIMNVPKQGDLTYAIVNYAWGGRYKLIPKNQLSPIAQDVSIQAGIALGLDAGAIDLIQDENGDWLVLEAEIDNFVYHLCRGFRNTRRFNSAFDFDRKIAEYITSNRLRTENNRTTTSELESSVRGVVAMLKGDYVSGTIV